LIRFREGTLKKNSFRPSARVINVSIEDDDLLARGSSSVKISHMNKLCSDGTVARAASLHGYKHLALYKTRSEND